MTQAIANIDSKSVNSTLTRRAALTGIACVAMPVSAAAVCVAPTEKADPIFAAIDRYTAALAAAEALNRATWEVTDDEGNEVFGEHTSAFAELLAMTPTSVAGCVAMLRCIQSFNEISGAEPYDGWYEPISGPGATLYRRLAGALESGEVRS